jgi:hypothetical protein
MNKFRHVTSASWLLPVLVLAASCSSPGPGQGPNEPSATPPAGSRLVSGRVWLYGTGGAMLATSGSVSGWIERAGHPRTTQMAPIAADGRYQLYAPEGATVFLTGPSSFLQPCAARTIVNGEVTLDLHTINDPAVLGANLPEALSAQAPTLSGIVYRQTPSGPLPLPNATVQLNTANGIGPIIAQTRTDTQGRYVLCAVHATPDLAVVASLAEHNVSTSSEDLRGVTTLNIELRWIDFASSY